MPKGLKEFTDNDYTLSVSSMFGCNNTEMPVWEADVILRKLEPVGDLNGNGETTEYNALDIVTMYGCMTMPPVESEAFTEYGFKDQFDLADSVSANFAALFESMIRPDTESPYPETGVFKLDLRNSQGEAPEEMSPDSYNTVLIDSFSYSDLQSLTDFLEYFDNVIVSAIPVTEEYAGRIVALLFSSGDSEAKEAFQDAGWNILPVHTSMVDSISDSGKIQPRKVEEVLCACRIIESI